MEGMLRIHGLDPELAYSARLLDARWVAPDGEVIVYDPPQGTFSVQNNNHTLPPPPPTKAQLDKILGPAPDEGRYTPEENGTTTLLFGAWTSVYERFNTTPGRLEMRVRIDFYSYEAGPVLPLRDPGFTDTTDGVLRLTAVSKTGDALEFQTDRWRALTRWRVPMEDRWSSSWRRLLRDSETGRRGFANRGGASTGNTVFGSLRRTRKTRTLQAEDQRQGFPELNTYSSWELVHVAPRYLGSAEVDVAMEAFQLVTKKNIEWAKKHDQTSYSQ
jgi:hypothetical protein